MTISFDLNAKEPACFIFGAGEFYGLQNKPKAGDLVIAADGGLQTLEQCRIKPDIVLGDFDSMPVAEAEKIAGNLLPERWLQNGSTEHAETAAAMAGAAMTEKRKPNASSQRNALPEEKNNALKTIEAGAEQEKEMSFVRLSETKDRSDSAAAILLGEARGYRRFYLYGCTGGRLDHTLASVQDIAALSIRGCTAYLFDKNAVLTALHKASLVFPAGMRGSISVFSHSDCCSGVRESGLKYIVADHQLNNVFPLGLSNEFTSLPASVSVAEGTLVLYIGKQ